MIVVTGTPRSGTSMIMQTLKLLGIPIVGDAFDDRNNPEHNPRGYWELPLKETIDGINDHRYRGHAVKLLSTDLTRTKGRYIDRIIFITRYHNYAIKSYQKVIADHKVFGMQVNNFFKPTRENAKKLFYMALKCAEDYLDEHPGIKRIKFDYKDFINNPVKETIRLKDFLKLNGTDIKEAVMNIKNKHR